MHKDSLIGIKPNLVVAKPVELGATTSPELVEGVIEYLISNGFKNIIILEGAWVGDITLSLCSKVMDVDYLINMPVLKGHCQTNITCLEKYYI